VSERDSVMVEVERGVVLEGLTYGDGPDLLLIPSAHRSGDDFARLASDLHRSGHGSLAVNPRGIGRSTGKTEGLTLRDIANDIAAMINQTAGRPLHVVGHAQGNVFARATAAFRPEVVRTVTLLACGGHDLAAQPPSAELLMHFERCGDQSLPDDVRLESLQFVFFAQGNDPSPWLGGWWPAADVRGTLTATDPTEWATAGDAPVLILQPMEDPLCPPTTGRHLRDVMGPRAAYVEIPHCSHAMLPEQPDLIADALIGFVDG
jgi:pimeloyl-ACP methyl ester carboxylesterase